MPRAVNVRQRARNRVTPALDPSRFERPRAGTGSADPGTQCLNGTGIRFGSQNAGQSANPPFTVISAAATVASGNTRYYQLH